MPRVKKWLSDMRRFLKRVTPIIAESIRRNLNEEVFISVDPPSPILRSAEKILPYSIPKPLRDFFQKGSAEVRFRYSWQPSEEVRSKFQNLPQFIYGGMDLSYPDPVFSVYRLYDYVDDARDYASWSGISDIPEEQEIWNRSIPFSRWNNADFLAFDPIVDPLDPYIVYLGHESGARFLSRNLASFLIEWQRCCYFGPGDIYHLRPFLDAETTALSGDTVAAQELRRAFGLDG